MNQVEHLQKQKSNLKQQLSDMIEKIHRIRRSLILETRPEERFRLEALVREAEDDRSKIEQELNRIDSRLTRLADKDWTPVKAPIFKGDQQAGKPASKGRFPVWALPILASICLLCAIIPFIPWPWPPVTPPPVTKTPTETPTKTPTIEVNIGADPTTIYEGECTVLYWNIQNAQEVLLEGENVPNEGQRKICPETTTTYTWYIVSLDGRDLERSQTIEVIPATEPTPEINIWADRTAIYEGECTVLYWYIQNVQEVLLEGENVPSEGQQEVCPETTTTYTWYIVRLDGRSLERGQTIEIIPTTEPPPEDSDDDDVPDDVDDCPLTANPNQSDTENDGVGDVCDNCPDTSNPGQEDNDNDGVGDVCDNCPNTPSPDREDNDSDGVGDVCDNCPNTSNPGQEDKDSDKVGDACDNCSDTSNSGQEDKDSDKVGDACDNCPNTPNPGQEDKDSDKVGDACDNCPNTSNPGQEDNDSDGKGDACDNCTGKIAFHSDREGNLEIYVMNADGGDLTRLTDNPAADGVPAWSPDCRKIAFASDRVNNYSGYRESNLEIYVMNADGNDLRKLTDNTTLDGIPTWSPDGQQIAFESKRDGNHEIYVMNADGTNQRRLTYNPSADLRPTWSPDSQQIAFTSDRDGNYEIYVMNANGSDQERLTNNPAWDGNPDWSLVSQQIAFQSDRDGNYEIYVMNASGSDQERLTNNPARDWNPDWSSDGDQILFNSDRDGNFEIYTINVDDSGVTRLTHNSAFDNESDW